MCVYVCVCVSVCVCVCVRARARACPHLVTKPHILCGTISSRHLKHLGPLGVGGIVQRGRLVKSLRRVPAHATAVLQHVGAQRRRRSIHDNVRAAYARTTAWPHEQVVHAVARGLKEQRIQCECEKVCVCV